MQWNEQQQRAIDLVLNGQNVFITGSAGTGKSAVIQEIVKRLRDKKRRVYICAPTGIAACNIGGSTVHSFAGIGTGVLTIEKLVERVNKYPIARERWLTAHVLIIDEISMLSRDLFEKLEAIARMVRWCPKPFGGIQMIFSGDFYQLPPVSNDINRFCFESEKWSLVVPNTVVLTQIFRQRDEQFAKFLNEARTGQVSDEFDAILAKKVCEYHMRGAHKEACEHARDSNHGAPTILPTILYPTNNKVNVYNEEKLRELNKPIKTFIAQDMGQQKLLENLVVPQCLEICEGAQVILLCNLTPDLVNGSRGVVVQCEPEPVVKFTGDNVVTLSPYTWEQRSEQNKLLARRVQIPLKLAWALSIHKSQGMSIDNLEVDIGHSFEYGQSYVALSRATSLDTLHVQLYSRENMKADPKVKAYYSTLSSNAS